MASIAQTGRPIYYWSGSAWLPISSTIGDFETIQDVTADMFTSHGLHENISVTYDDSTGRMILSADGAVTSVNTQVGDVVLDTDDVLEANNLYFTNQRAINATSSIINSASVAAVNESTAYTNLVLPNASAAAVSAIRWKYKGAYNNGLDYAPDDVVTYDTSLWIRIGEPNPGYVPYVGSAYWQLLAISEIDLTNYLTTASAAAIYHTTASATASVAYLEELISQLFDSISPSSASATASRITAYVKNGSTSLAKGVPVYITGADGTNIIVGPASNDSESTSSKTLGFTQTALSANQHGYIVLEGSLNGLNTNGANAGDPIWLGETPGTVIYGLANKPQAPNHLVYLGVVSRKNQNNGEIFVKIQNGFELKELHDVRINGVANGDIVKWNSASSLWINTPLVTTTIPEGSNLYYTEARALASASNIFIHPNHQNLSASLINNQIILSASGGGGGGGASLIVSASAPVIASEGDGWFDNTDGSFYVYDGTFWVETASNVSVDQESAQDLVAPLLVHGNHENLTATYNDVGNKIILTVSGGGAVESVNNQTGEVTLTTTNISEGSNLYFTNVRAINAGSATYLTQTNAANTYLTQANAASTYETQSNANATYAPKASPIFTGNPQAPTPSTSTNSTIIATTAYVKNQGFLTSASAAANLLSQANATSTYYPKTGGTISGNVSITGDLTVSGSTTTVNTETINLADNIITLNSNATGSPTENAGIEIERGTSSNVAIRWNETNDKWEFTRDGSTYKELGSGAVIYQTTQPDTSDIEPGTLWIDSNQAVGTGLDIQTITRWYKTISASTTTISGLDDENTNLLYRPGFELVYVNGTLINRGLDYTATTGDTIVLNEAVLSGDLIEIHSYQSFMLIEHYTKTESDNRYLSQINASANYLSINNASSTYVAKTDTELVKYGSVEPLNPDTGTIWIDSTNITSPITKVYNGTTWIIASGADAGLHPFFMAGI
jgi:hypothetical protein